MSDNLDLNHHNVITRWWRSVDQHLIISLALLFAFSIILAATASPAVANRIGLVDNYFAMRQVVYLSIGGILVISCSMLDKKWIKRFAILGFLFSLLMLVLVKFVGYEVKGATRWISIAGFSYQPSEFMKPFFAIMVGWILSLKYQDPSLESQVNITLISIYSAIALLLILQPDFGTLVLMTSVFILQLFVSGLPMIWLFMAFIIGIFGISASYFMLPHVAARINKFLDPAAGENYQVTRSIMAFEHGGIYGVGPGEGVIKQNLPDSHTDFIFAVSGEEFGAIISIVIIMIFAYIVLRTIMKLMDEYDKFIQFASLGIIAQFGLQAAINIGVTLNLLPTKGMTLPFISCGGSSTLSTSLAIGMLMGLTKRKARIRQFRLQNIEV